MPVVLSLRHHSSDGHITAFLTRANRISLITAFVFSWMIFPLKSNCEKHWNGNKTIGWD